MTVETILIERDKYPETYLGDGLYASYDGFAIWLRAPRIEGDHTVCLEPAVFRELLKFAMRAKENAKSKNG